MSLFPQKCIVENAGKFSLINLDADQTDNKDKAKYFYKISTDDVHFSKQFDYSESFVASKDGKKIGKIFKKNRSANMKIIIVQVNEVDSKRDDIVKCFDIPSEAGFSRSTRIYSIDDKIWLADFDRDEYFTIDLNLGCPETKKVGKIPKNEQYNRHTYLTEDLLDGSVLCNSSTLYDPNGDYIKDFCDDSDDCSDGHIATVSKDKSRIFITNPLLDGFDYDEAHLIYSDKVAKTRDDVEYRIKLGMHLDSDDRIGRFEQLSNGGFMFVCEYPEKIVYHNSLSDIKMVEFENHIDVYCPNISTDDFIKGFNKIKESLPRNFQPMDNLVKIICTYVIFACYETQ